MKSNTICYYFLHFSQEQIKQINIRLKQAEARSEYAEMNISKLHLRIDDLGTILNDYEYLMNINYDSRG